LNNFYEENLTKSKTKKLQGMHASLWYYWKALDEWDFGGDFENFKLR